MEPNPLENDPKYVNTHHHRRRERWVKIAVAMLGLLTAIVTLIASVVGANTPKSAAQQAGFGGDIVIGFQVLSQVVTQGKLRVDASKAPTQPLPTPASVSPAGNPASTEQKKISQEMPVGIIPDASCYGLNEGTWSVSAEPVIRLSGAATGYNVNFRLHNTGNETIYMLYDGDTFLRDDAGNRIKMTAATIERPSFGYAGTKVDPGAYFPISLTFTGPASGKTVGFDIKLVMNPINGAGKLAGSYGVMFGCTKLPVAGSTPSS